MVRSVRVRLALILLTALLVSACTSRAQQADSTAPPSPSWPSPADSGAPAQNGDQLGVVGDSLTAEMIEYGLLEPALIEAGWDAQDIRLDGDWGRPIDGTTDSSTSAVIRSWRKDGFDPRVWLIALGTNNASSPVSQWHQDIRGVLNEINTGPAGNYRIYWVSTGYPQQGVSNQALFLQTLHEIAADYPNVEVADYDAFLDGHRDDANWADMWADPVHHSKSGYELLRTPFYLDVLADEAPG